MDPTGLGIIHEHFRAVLAPTSKTDVVERPETRYTSVGDADVAYQVFGEGPDLLYFYGLGSHIEQIWDDAVSADFFRRLASFSRVIIFDRRGTGASDSVPRNAIPTWEEWTEDIGAVLDAVGSEHATIFAVIDGGPISILYAVAHPERVNGLVLQNTTAKYTAGEDYPIGAAPEAVEALLELMRTQWGTVGFMELNVPSTTDDPTRAEILARQLRSAATPRTAVAQYDYVLRSVDVRSVLGMIRVPTLIFQVREFPFLPIDHGRYLAKNIAGARLIELPGGDVNISPQWSRQCAEEIAEFVTGKRPAPEVDRVLTTLMFSDIVDSTAHAARMGDLRWRNLLDLHDLTVREEIRNTGGREVNTTGDGFFASFVGPARAIRCAQAIGVAANKLGVELRVGLHTGECEVRGEDLGGLAVHIAARIGAMAGPGEVLVSGTVKDLVAGSGIEFSDRGEHELKGVPGTWKLFAVVG